MDRWVIDIEGRRSRRLHMNWLPHRKLQMYNYFSVGVDAQIALDFHKARASPFYIFSSRFLNKVSSNFPYVNYLKDQRQRVEGVLLHNSIFVSDSVPLLRNAAGVGPALCWSREKDLCLHRREKHRIAGTAVGRLSKY